jgi:integrase
MELREKKGRWEYRFRVNGQNVSKLTAWAATAENRSRTEAEKKRHRDAILRGYRKLGPRPAGRGFTEASEDFVRSLKFGRTKDSTNRRIETSMASLRLWFRDTDLGKIRVRDVEDYKVWRLEGDAEIAAVRPITVLHDLQALSKFYKWAIRMELVTANPVAEAEKPSTEDAVRMHILTPAEEMDYFHRCAEAGYRNLADSARLILEQGLRPEEAMRLERRGVDLERGRIRIFEGKTRAARRTLKLTPASLEIVARRMWESDSPWLFPSPKTKTRAGQPITKLNGPHDKVCASCEAKASRPARPPLHFVLYDLRHTYATRMAERGMPLATLAAILGHNSLRMVMRYVHPTQDHMDSETVRISEMMEREKISTKTLVDQSWPGPTSTNEDAQAERVFNDLAQRPAKIEKPN